LLNVSIMKEMHHFRASLGLTQQEMAMILQVTRSQWSLYELGLRRLPSDGAIRLAELVKAIEAVKSLEGKVTPSAVKQKQHQDNIQKLLNDNLHKQYSLVKKITAEEENMQVVSKMALTAAYLKANETQGPYHTFAISRLEHKVAKAGKKNGLSRLRQLQIQLEVLQHEELLYRKELSTR
jgi:transcriptional regulator with XRE-family HTH domain